MAFFDKITDVGKIVAGAVAGDVIHKSLGPALQKLPVGLSNIAGDFINQTIFGQTSGGLTGPVRIMREGQKHELTDFKKFQADLRMRGVARPNRFLVIFSGLPAGFSRLGQFSKSMEFINGKTSFLTLSCEDAAYPGVNFQTTDVKFQNHMEKLPYMKAESDVSLTFRCDNEMLEKKFFDMWSALIKNKVNGDFSYKREYQLDIEILQFNEEGNITYGIVLENAFPVNINDIALSHNSANDYSRIGVSFSYDRILVEGYDSPFYEDSSLISAQGMKSASYFDRIKSELFNHGTNVVLQEVSRKIPLPTVPGIGSARDLIGRFF